MLIHVGTLSAENRAEPKIVSTFICTSSGTMTGWALDIRVETIVTAISTFHEEHKRVPQGIEELRGFCEKRGIELHDLNRLSAVEFENGRFSYSAYYSEGSLHLSHLPGRYLTFDMLEPPKTAPSDTGQPAAKRGDEVPAKVRPPTPESKDGPR